MLTLIQEIPNVIMYGMIFFSLYFQVFLLITFLENKNKINDETVQEATSFPRVSITVPCHNEERSVIKTVNSLLDLNYPKDKLKIFVVDDGSTDSTWEVLQRYKNNPRITILHKENGGKFSALNYALERIDSPFVGCLDADSFVDSDALLSIMKYFSDEEVMAVTPAIKIYNPKSIIQKIQSVEYVMSIFIRKMLGMMDAIQVTPGPFSIFRKKVFDITGPYKHAHNTEDMEIAMRMHKHHMKIVNSHTASVYTMGPKTLRALLKQRVRWIYGFLKNATDYRTIFFKKEYGNLGLFTFPAAVISIFSGLYFLGYTIYSTLHFLIHKIVQIETVGISFKFKSFHFDWFFFDTGSTVFLIVTLFFITLSFTILGNYMTEQKARFPRGMLYYLALYGLIAPLWLARAVYNVALSRMPKWDKVN
jgi:cellulose synthase/poly-beta-1,6-N-acetylglucosamine synthase-like glycosyltransferase